MSILQRKSFYPLPPSIYPLPILDPAPAYETTTAREHGARLPKDVEFYRSRTFNDTVLPSVQSGEKDIYPRHGIGAYTTPYYRRDSKGFRAPYTQPAYVDQEYIARDQWRRSMGVDRLGASVSSWAHPASRANYRDGPLSNFRQPAGRPVSQGYGGSTVGQLQNTNSQPIDVGPSAENRPWTSPEQERAAYEAANRDRQRTAILGDPLLVDPLANAYRKSRTVYKRAYGKSR